MIDVSEELLSAAPRQTHRRAAVTAARTMKNHVPPAKKPLGVSRVFSDPKIKPFDQLKWERRTAEINDDAGKVIFKQEKVETPETWSQLATKVVVSKYFYGEQGTAER